MEHAEILLLSKNTLIPIGAAFCFAGGAAWMARLHGIVKNHEKKLDNIGKIYDKLNEISERLARMEGRAE